jgi:hypothetical protein
MARIRTTKPEYWTSQQVVDCSPIARLLFIGLWNFCDDGGIHPAEPKRLKMEVFPGDDFTTEQIAGWIGELIQVGLLREYEAEGRRYWLVTGWHHQKIDRPNYKYPKPQAQDSVTDRRTLAESSSNDRREVSEDSSSIRGTVGDQSPPEGKGREGKGVNLSTPDGVDVRSAAADPPPRNGKTHPAVPPCPHREIIELYHEILHACPRVREWNQTREGLLRARWKQSPQRQDLAWWRSFFGYVAESKFLTGQTDPRDGKPPFIADFEWIVKPSNFAKIVEGKYHDREARAAA